VVVVVVLKHKNFQNFFPEKFFSFFISLVFQPEQMEDGKKSRKKYISQLFCLFFTYFNYWKEILFKLFLEIFYPTPFMVKHIICLTEYISKV